MLRDARERARPWASFPATTWWCLLLAIWPLQASGGGVSFHNLISRTHPGATFEVTIVGPESSTSTVALAIHNTSQGRGQLGGEATVQLDGGKPYSTATFRGVSISETGLYALEAKSDALMSVSSFVQVVPEQQCNGKPWSAECKCGECVALTQLGCVYCPALQACLAAGWRGPQDHAACPDYYISNCLVPGEYTLLLLPAVVCTAAFALACYCVCVCCRRRSGREDRIMHDYDAKFNLAWQRERDALYGSTETSQPSRARRTEEQRRLLDSKYNISGGAP